MEEKNVISRIDNCRATEDSEQGKPVSIVIWMAIRGSSSLDGGPLRLMCSASLIL